MNSIVASTASNSGALVVLILATVAIAGTAVAVTVHTRGVKTVRGASSALRQLNSLRGDYQILLSCKTPLVATYRNTARSKAALDKFDFSAMIRDILIEHETQFSAVVKSWRTVLPKFQKYWKDLETIRRSSLGRTISPSIGQKRFKKIEEKQFNRLAPKPWYPQAQIQFIATYTSPQGRNHYTRHVVWSYAEVEKGLSDARAYVQRLTSAAYQRERERSLMTPKMRTDILRRDGYRCRFCGRGAADGVTLHVDHIFPVSRGGKTELRNLQALCSDCNLGKGSQV
jgi:hypothetical protein